MKKRSLVLIGAAILFTTVSCVKEVYVKPNPTETDTFLSQNPDLTDFDKDCIANGVFKPGMQSKTLHFLLGEPKEKTTKQQSWGTQEVWMYNVGGGKKLFSIEDGGVVGIEEMK